MSQENQEVEVTTVNDDAAFDAGLAMARGDESPTIDEPKVEEPVAETTEAAPEPVAEVPQPVFAGLTEDQLKAQLAKAGEVDELKNQIRQIYGKMGEYNGKLNQLSQGSARKLTAETFSRLKEAGYDDLAEKLAEDLSNVQLGGGQAEVQQVDLTPIHTQIKQMQEQQEMKLLTMRHRSWQQDVNSDDFRLWSQTLSAEDRQLLNDSWDAMALGDKLDDYKAWRERAAQAQPSKQQKQQRLEAAVTPAGVPSAAKAAIDDDEAFYAGLKSVRGR